MVGQIMEQLPITQLGQKGSSQRSNQDGGAGFDEMLQQKRQVSDEPAAVRENQPVEKTDAPKQEAAEAGRPAPREDEELLDDAKAVLAAMLVQPPVEAVTVQAPEAGGEAAVETVQVEPAAEEGVAEAPQATGLIPQVQPEATAESPIYAETATETAQPEEVFQPRQTGTVEREAPVQQTREAPVQTAEQPRQAPEQAETVTRAPEAAQIQPPQTPRHGEQSPEVQMRGEAPRQTPGQTPRQTDDETPAETPLFQPETAEQSVPVKVADPAPVLNREQPLPIESEQAPEQLAEIMVTGVENGREVSIIRLNPENLGPVRMTISRDAEGTLHMALEAANPKTQTLLEKHAGNVGNIVSANLHEDVRVEVRQNDHAEQQDWTDGRERQDRQQQSGHRRGQRDEGTDDEFVQRLRLGLIRSEDDDE